MRRDEAGSGQDISARVSIPEALVEHRLLPTFSGLIVLSSFSHGSRRGLFSSATSWLATRIKSKS